MKDSYGILITKGGEKLIRWKEYIQRVLKGNLEEGEEEKEFVDRVQISQNGSGD